MSELGQMLKKARLERGLTLDDVQEATKIRKRYLEAIEEGDYKVLPGAFYVRAFVKTYAEHVGLNPDELAPYYTEEMQVSEPETPIEPMIRKKRSVQHTDRFGKWATTILMWSFFILIIVIIYLVIVSQSGKDGDGKKTTDNSGITDSVVQPGPNNGDNGSSNGSANEENTNQQEQQEPEEKKDPIVIQVSEDRVVVSSPDNQPLPFEVKLIDGSFLSLNAGDERLVSGSLEKGQDQSFTISEKGIRALFGNAERCEVTIAGTKIELGKGLNKRVSFEWMSYEEAQNLQQTTDGASNSTTTDGE
ncbi:helix-turn-helix domain-containing protein [Paenibacillus sp. 1001270B_150601_E10]|uniref:helix-turn-helix domain-containing protein n=1 Tax=Paenibacillus sp. 1001270B_150601_E10 TaxID=2787079 RepID=UPI00189EAEA3|nr:helix-turn-helix domain-containing protein [Paenibacillus sp. 1001270B_150601_E10]